MRTNEQLDHISQNNLKDFVREYADDPKIFREILSIYLKETPDRLTQLRKALGSKDLESIGRVAHGLANTFGTLKMQGALQCARDLETAARNNDLLRVSELCPVLLSQTEKSLTEAESWLNNKQGTLKE